MPTELSSVSEIADSSSVREHDVRNIIRLRRIEPTRRVGRVLLFDGATAARIRAELDLKRQRQQKAVRLYRRQDLAAKINVDLFRVDYFLANIRPAVIYILVDEPLYDVVTLEALRGEIGSIRATPERLRAEKLALEYQADSAVFLACDVLLNPKCPDHLDDQEGQHWRAIRKRYGAPDFAFITESRTSADAAADNVDAPSPL